MDRREIVHASHIIAVTQPQVIKIIMVMMMMMMMMRTPAVAVHVV